MGRDATLEILLTKTKGFMDAQVILTAHELGLFDAMGRRSFTAAALAREMNLSERGLSILLDALTALGMMVKEKELYHNTGMAMKHLMKAGEDYRGATLDHITRMRDMWLRLHDAVRTGTSPRRPEESLVNNRERNRSFILAMKDLGTPNGAIIAANLDLSPCRRLLDLGGGPGSYAMEIIKRFPLIRATLVDLPLTLEVAREVVDASGMADRIALKCADFYSDPAADIGKGYDVALLSNILHIEGPQSNRRLLARVCDAMTDKGMIIIHEAIIDENRTSPPDRALFALNMLVHTERGNCYTFSEMKDWLEEAGFSGVRLVDCFDRPSLMIGWKSAG